MKRMIKKIVMFILALSILTGVSDIHSNCDVVLAAEETAEELTSAPNAVVRYHYSPTIACGSIRYISQMSGNDYFYSDYWGRWTGCAGSECYTSCISMALSYIGINITPDDILTQGGGVTRPQLSWGGAKFSTDSVENAVDKYINGEGKYSPPIIHLNGYSGYGHYVVLAGQISDTEYQVLDPAISSVWNIHFNGNTVTYSIHGRTYTDTVTTAYQYYNSEASLLDPSEASILDLSEESVAEQTDANINMQESLNHSLLNIGITE